MNKEHHLQPENTEKGMTPELCYERAVEIISKNGVCLLLMDLVGSSKMEERFRSDVFDRYSDLLTRLNEEFEDYLPANKLVNGSREDKGFVFALGDAAAAAINSPHVVNEVIEIVNNEYPDIPLRYGVAEDGWDEEGVRLVK